MSEAQTALDKQKKIDKRETKRKTISPPASAISETPPKTETTVDPFFDAARLTYHSARKGKRAE